MLSFDGKPVWLLKRLVLVLVIVLVATSISFQYFGIGFGLPGGLVHFEDLRDFVAIENSTGLPDLQAALPVASARPLDTGADYSKADLSSSETAHSDLVLNPPDTSASEVGTSLVDNADTLDSPGSSDTESESSAGLPHATGLNSLQPDVDLSALEGLCGATEWQTGLYVRCDPISGGVGNVAALLLGCVRYSIHVGARLIVPNIELRDTDSLFAISGHQDGIAYMFNEQHLISSLNKACPQLAIGSRNYEDFEESQYLEYTAMPIEVPDPLTELSIVRNRLNVTKMTPIPTWLEPRVARLGMSFSWPIHFVDSPKVFRTFGNILRFNDLIYALANEVIAQLQKKADKYLGVHLRTAADAPATWTLYEEQRDAYLAKAILDGYRAIFVASGDAVHSAQFKDAAAVHNIECFSKLDLLSSEHVNTLKSLTWDQQSFVDFVVLMQAEHFMGIRDSSFATQIAFTRHLKLDLIEQFDVPGDALSTILGQSLEPLFRTAMFPTLQLANKSSS